MITKNRFSWTSRQYIIVKTSNEDATSIETQKGHFG